MSAGRTAMEMRAAAINALTPIVEAFASGRKEGDEADAVDVATFALLELAGVTAATAAGVMLVPADCEAHEAWAAGAFKELNDLAAARKLRGRP